MSKFLTIGIAVYNIKEAFLKSCLKSVLLNCGENIEILTVDDCSDAYCSEICRKYSESDRRVKYIRNERNMGISAVRNRIIDMASGRWLVFVDGDDMLSHNICEMLSKPEAEEYDVIIFNNKTVSEEDSEPETPQQNTGKPSFAGLSAEEVLDIAEAAIVRRSVRKCCMDGFRLNPGSVWAQAYRTEFLKIGGFRFDESLKIAEDSVFNANVFLKEPKTAVCNQIGYYYRVNHNSQTTRYNENSKDVTDAYLKAAEKLINEQFGGRGEVMDEFLMYRCTRAVADNFERNIFHKDNPRTYKERKREFCELIETEPYRTAISCVKTSELKENRLRLNIMLAKRRMFGLLDIFYGNKVLFKLYGGLSNRINKLKRG